MEAATDTYDQHGIAWFRTTCTLKQNKKEFIRRHPLEILAVALPMLRPLRVIRVISFGSMVFEKVAIGRSLGILIRLLVVTLFLGYIAAIQITLMLRLWSLNSLTKRVKAQC